MASINLDLYLHVLTPVHVGGADDKNLVEGLDYLIENGKVYIFDQKKLRKTIGNDNQYISALEEGKKGINNLLNVRHIPLGAVSYSPKIITGSASEIKACIKNGMNGKPYIPGSSIKGAVRSMIFSHIYKQLSSDIKSKIKNERKPDDSILGAFQNSLMRFIQVSDVYFEGVETEIHNAKIFNLRYSSDNWEGGWKNQLDNDTTENFKPEGFTFAYEIIPAHSIGKFRLSFSEDVFEKAKKSRDLNIKNDVKDIFNNGFQKAIFNILQTSTDSYLKKEIDFFNKYNIQETDLIIESIREVGKENNSTSPVFRMSSGSGFHSITGDWQYESSHVVSNVWGNPFDKLEDRKTPNPDFDKDYIRFGISFKRRKKLSGGLMWKSRRLLFSDRGDEYIFTPMGFVQICTSQFYEAQLKGKVAAARAAAEAEALKTEKARKRKEEAERLAAEEAKKPTWRSFEDVKKDKIIDGEVIGQKGIQVLIRPFVKGYEEQKLHVRFAMGLPVGTIVEVKANVFKKEIRLSPPPKVK